MLLKDLMNEIKEKLMVDEELRAYLYEDKIVFIDFTSGFSQDGIDLEDFYGTLLTVFIKDKKISCIENESIHLITPVNKNIVSWLTTLIEVEIEDIDKYPKLKSIEDQDYIKV